MAKIGLRHPVVAKRVESNGSVSYTHGTNFAKLVKQDVKVEKNNAELYADDELDESDNSFKKATITADVNDFGMETSSLMLGHEYDAVNKQEISSGDDVAPYTGYGAYIVKQKNNVVTYVATFFPKVKWEEPDQTDETKGDSAKFSTTTITGVIMKDELQGKKWRFKREFKTEAAAIAWLNEKAGLATKVANPTFSVVGGSYSEAKSVELACDTSGATIYYTTNGTTPSADNGTEYSSAISVTSTQAIRAIAVKSNCVDSDLVCQEYIIEE